MCWAGLPSAGGYEPLWQLAQSSTGICVWFHLVGFQLAVLWQAKQLVAATGMWAPGLPVALLPLWQLEQLVATVKVLWSTLAPLHVLVDLWQFSHAVWPAWMVVLGRLLRWQVEHWLVTVTPACRRAGVQLA